jgi:hypothetical protein
VGGAVTRARAVGLACVLLVGCRQAPLKAEACGAANCAGCCTAQGACDEGASQAACGLAGAACVRCRGTSQCDVIGACRAAPPDAGVEPSSSCQAPGVLDLRDGGTRFITDLGPAGDDGRASCAGALAEDRVWQLAVNAADAVLLHASPLAGDTVPVLAVRAACATGELPGACVAGVASAVWLPPGVAQGQFAWLDATSPDAGQVVFEALTGTGACAGAPVLGVGAGTTLLAMVGAGEVQLEVTGEGTLSLEVDTHDAREPVTLVLTMACEGTGLLAQTLAPGVNTVELGLVEAGRYALRLGGGGAALRFTLHGDAAGESCRVPTLLAHAGDGGFEPLTDTTVGALDDEAPVCGPAGRPDRVHAFTLPSEQNVLLTVTPREAGFQPVVTLRQGGCGGLVRACASAAGPGQPVTLQQGHLAAGEWQVAVDGVGAAGGAYTVALQTRAPGWQERCYGGTLLFDAGVAVVEGNTWLGSNTQWAACLNAPPANDETWYLWLPNELRTVRARVESLAPGFEPALFLNPQCRVSTTTSCAQRVDGGAELTITETRQENLTVDAFNGATGPYRLTVWSTPVAPGDACSTALALDAGVPVTLDFSALHADFAPSCAAPASDAVFTFATPAGQRAVVTASADAGAVVSVTTQALLSSTQVPCGPRVPERRCEAGSPVASGELRQESFQQVGYAVVGASPGPVTVRVDYLDPLPGDACPGPATTGATRLPLAITADGGVDGGVVVDLSRLYEDRPTLCGRLVGGPTNPLPDALYAFTLPFAATLVITAVGDGDLAPLVDVTRLTTAAACSGVSVGCDGGVPGNPPVVLTPSLTAGTWLLTVKAADVRTTHVTVQVSR